MNPKEDKTYGVALSEKQLKFLVQCIDIAQKTESISPDKERRTSSEGWERNMTSLRMNSTPTMNLGCDEG